MAILRDIPEHIYHSDAVEVFGDVPRFTASTGKAMDAPSKAHMHHPRLGGQPMVPTTTMDRGSLMHAMLLGKGGQVAVVNCDDWRTKAAKEAREEHRNEGRIAVTSKLFDDARVAAKAIREKLRKLGYNLAGESELTLTWDEDAASGRVIPCRARLDHLDGSDIFDLKITENASPTFIERQIKNMGYHLQGAAYRHAVEANLPELVGRTVFTLLFCEPEPPYCITPTRFLGPLRELGETKWARARDRWDECLHTNRWPDYVDNVFLANAKPWDFESAA